MSMTNEPDSKARGKKILRVVIMAGVSGVVLAVGVAIYYFGEIVLPTGARAATLHDVESLVSSYIKVNHGQFPSSEDELVSQGFLKRIRLDGEYQYRMGPSCFDPDSLGAKCWPVLPSFASFTLAYGAKSENIEVVNDILRDKRTGRQILLIVGPHKKTLKRTDISYESVSLNWYHLMLEHRQAY